MRKVHKKINFLGIQIIIPKVVCYCLILLFSLKSLPLLLKVPSKVSAVDRLQQTLPKAVGAKKKEETLSYPASYKRASYFFVIRRYNDWKFDLTNSLKYILHSYSSQVGFFDLCPFLKGGKLVWTDAHMPMISNLHLKAFSIY